MKYGSMPLSMSGGLHERGSTNRWRISDIGLMSSVSNVPSTKPSSPPVLPGQRGHRQRPQASMLTYDSSYTVVEDWSWHLRNPYHAHRFPMVKNEDDELSVVSSFLPLFIYCAVMTNFIIAVNQVRSLRQRMI